MKNFSLSLIAFLLLSISLHAKIWRVNNNSGIGADFTTIQAANDGASRGDTIHVEGSPTSYGQLQTDKKLVIIGPGYFLGENANLQAFTLQARIDGVTYNFGAAGSELIGTYCGGITINCSDLAIKRNRFSNPGNAIDDWSTGIIYLNADNSTGLPTSNILISQNYGVKISIRTRITSVLITNNYLSGGVSSGSGGFCLEMDENAVALIQNNVIGFGILRAYNSNVSNNIIKEGGFEGSDNLTSNNIGNATQFGTTNGNKSNVDMATVFESTGSPDAFFKLKAGSPAIAAGYGSTVANPIDCGMYGGQSPYVLSGIPPIPAIYSFTNQPVGSANDPIDVTVKVRSNN